MFKRVQTTGLANQQGAGSPALREPSGIYAAWWPVALGLCALYLPTLFGIAQSIFGNGEQAQAPLIAAVVLYLIWQQRELLRSQNGAHEVPPLARWVGGLFFTFGLLIYAVGRSQSIGLLEVGSLIPVLAGILLVTRGVSTLKAFWFPLFFLLFMVPLPGSFIAAMTLPMKIAVSYVADNVLFWAGYPIARSGVILQIGQYQLMVADACAGMQTLISLEALGLLYLNLVKHHSVFRNFALALLIVPISFTANVVRVMILILITYYFGDEAGQGFIHGFAGMLLFVVALVMIMGLDSLLQWISRRRVLAAEKLS